MVNMTANMLNLARRQGFFKWMLTPWSWRPTTYYYRLRLYLAMRKEVR